MLTRIRAKHGTVVAYLALFAALATGGAYAADKIGSNDIAKNAVKSKHIKKGQVKESDIAKCPGGTKFYNGLCWEKESRSAATWFNAARNCADDKGRLPLAAELQGVFDKPGFDLGALSDSDGNIAAEVYDGDYTSVDDSGAISIPIGVNTSRPYRCVYERIR
jgi:hypothetical protein